MRGNIFLMIGRRLAESQHASVTLYRNFFLDSVEVHLSVEIRFVKLVILSYLEMWFILMSQVRALYTFCLCLVSRENRI